eukprot:TRINITY_DN2045_c0_g1_i1.p1 TRINITY_DN2045_c0_g1~~TRINITY_DN2045_c0_g1_i1.p1  ORF type:complete len:263 (-),score=34.05 TRINITY_DN2045_c0_g1_i1:123-911(-)
MTDFNVEELEVLNKEEAVRGLGSMTLFEDMIDEFQDSILIQSLEMLKIAFDDFDYLSIREQAHSLKASSSYIHADRVTAICEKMLDAISRQLPEETYTYYSILVEQCILLKNIITRELFETKGTLLATSLGCVSTKISSELEFPVCRYFKIVKVATNQFEVVSLGAVKYPPISKSLFDTNKKKIQKKFTFAKVPAGQNSEENKAKSYEIKTKKISTEALEKYTSSSKSFSNKVPTPVDEKLANKSPIEMEGECRPSCECRLL